ncbi:unnamed protein product [Nesidiocoris tenuis]|uniref:Uncharacterized protein n=1 Tax=Nesidiocoris tenuis TaxID=355587 RepID=A0A6H5HNE9_9HEMI|nr:unnamed protein product [Nesidiocoris tenuis]
MLRNYGKNFLQMTTDGHTAKKAGRLQYSHALLKKPKLSRACPASFKHSVGTSHDNVALVSKRLNTEIDTSNMNELLITQETYLLKKRNLKSGFYNSQSASFNNCIYHGMPRYSTTKYRKPGLNRIFYGRRFEPSVGVVSRGDRVPDWLSAARSGTTGPPRRLSCARRAATRWWAVTG